MLVASISNAQTTTISGTTYHGVSGDNFITIASAWNEGTITDAWDWNNLNWFYNGDVDNLNSLPGIAPGGLLIRYNGENRSVLYEQRDSETITEYFVVPSIGTNSLATGQGAELYNAATASGTVYLNSSEANREADRLTAFYESPFQAWERSTGGYHRYVTINGREYRIDTKTDATGSFSSNPYTPVFERTNPYNALVARGWTLHDQSGIDASFPDRTLPIAIHPNGNFAVLSIPGGAYNIYNYANGVFVGGNTHRFGSIEEVINHFGG